MQHWRKQQASLHVNQITELVSEGTTYGGAILRELDSVDLRVWSRLNRVPQSPTPAPLFTNYDQSRPAYAFIVQPFLQFLLVACKVNFDTSKLPIPDLPDMCRSCLECWASAQLEVTTRPKVRGTVIDFDP